MHSVVALGAPQRQGKVIKAALMKVLGSKCRVTTEASLDLEALLNTFITKFTAIVNQNKTLKGAKDQYIQQHQQYFAE